MSQLSDLVDGGDSGYVKQPGQWRRKGPNGPPIVSDPDGVAVKTGARAGQVKLLTYSRPSNFGKQVENTYNLEKWNERMVALGMALAADEDSIIVPLRTGDPDDPQWKKDADGVVVEAKRRAGAMRASDRGSHGHLLTEDHDLDRSIVSRLEAGEDLGLSPALQHAVVDAWRALVDDHFDVLAVEAPCVFDDWRVAGTLDRVVRLKHDLKFQTAASVPVILAAGTVIVLDIKTGDLKTDRNGRPRYWHSYAVQVAAYANSVPYDVDEERRGTWPWPISTGSAVIAHIDIGGALDTDVVTAQLVYVDLNAGRYAGELVCHAKGWQRRDDVFSSTGSYLVARTIAAPPVQQAGDGPALTSLPEAGPAALDRATVVTRARRLVEAGHGVRLSMIWPDNIPGLKNSGHTELELRAIYAAICAVEDEHNLSPGFVAADRTREPVPSWDEQRRRAAIRKARLAWDDYWEPDVMADILADILGENVDGLVDAAFQVLTIDEADRLAEMADRLNNGHGLEHDGTRWAVTPQSQATSTGANKQ